MSSSSPEPRILAPKSYQDLGLEEDLAHVLIRFGFPFPTRCQQQIIPILGTLPPRNFIGVGAPTFEKIQTYIVHAFSQIQPQIPKPQVMILLPKNIVPQVVGLAKPFADALNIRIRSLTTKISKATKQFTAKEIDSQLIITTPHRADNYIELGYLDTRTLWSVILDEADQLLDPEIPANYIHTRTVLEAIPKTTRRILFAPSINTISQRLLDKYFPDPEKAHLQYETRSLEHVKQFHVFLPDIDERMKFLLDVLGRFNAPRTAVFTEKPDVASYIVQTLREWAASTHKQIQTSLIIAPSSKTTQPTSPEDANKAVASFLSPLPTPTSSHILVLTGSLPFTLPSESINLIVQFELPLLHGVFADNELYIQRIGRTELGRFPGVVLNFISDDPLPIPPEQLPEGKKQITEEDYLNALEKFFQTEIPEFSTFDQLKGLLPTPTEDRSEFYAKHAATFAEYQKKEDEEREALLKAGEGEYPEKLEDIKGAQDDDSEEEEVDSEYQDDLTHFLTDIDKHMDIDAPVNPEEENKEWVASEKD